MKFDDILARDIGEFGCYQKFLFVLVSLLAIPCAFHSYGNVFLSATPKHHCQINKDFKYGENLTVVECFLPWNEENGEWERCERYNVTLADVVMGCNGSRLTTNCDGMWTYDRSIYGKTVVTEWNLVCDDTVKRQHSKSIVVIGKLVGSLIFGQLSDVIGRKKALMLAFSLQFLSGLASAFAPSFATFITFQFLVGAASAGYIVAFVIVNELVCPAYRTVTGIVIDYFYTVGYLLLGLIAYIFKDWRNIELAFTLPGLVFLSYFWLIPESPRWLLSKGRIKECNLVLQKVAKHNGRRLPEDYENVLSSVHEENPASTKETFVDVFKSPVMRIKTLLVCFTWMTNSMIYAGLSYHTESLGTNPYISFLISGAVEIPAYAISQLSINRVGRRPMISAFMAIGGAAMLFSTVLQKHVIPVLIIAMFGKFCITASYGIVYLYAAEIYPTSVRNMGVGCSSIVARIGSTLAPYILLLSDFSFEALPLILFGALSLVCGILFLLLPETRGRKLPESIADADKAGLTTFRKCCNWSRDEETAYKKQKSDDIAL